MTLTGALLSLAANLCRELACACLGHRLQLLRAADTLRHEPALWACRRCRAVHTGQW